MFYNIKMHFNIIYCCEKVFIKIRWNLNMDRTSIFSYNIEKEFAKYFYGLTPFQY